MKEQQPHHIAWRGWIICHLLVVSRFEKCTHFLCKLIFTGKSTPYCFYLLFALVTLAPSSLQITRGLPGLTLVNIQNHGEEQHFHLQ